MFGGLVIALVLMGRVCLLISESYETYSEAKRQFSVMNRDVLMNAISVVWESVDKWWESVDLQFTCHPSPSFITFVFRSSEVSRLLLDLNPYGGTDPLDVSQFCEDNC